ncbi:MAG TPA: hypothetical protein VGN57_23445 [Pirellulaceae bacterium]|jgi:hypothetical protein|nr:hypothetical protein [Pirellulaceae bacterium]
MNERGTILRAIAWNDLFPWLLLLRTFRLSISLTVMALATLGTLLTPVGWWAAEALFVSPEMRQVDATDDMVSDSLSEWAEDRRRIVDRIEPADVPDSYPLLVEKQWTFGAAWEEAWRGLALPFLRISEPFRMLLVTNGNPATYAYFLMGGLWTLLVWSLFGFAICRRAALYLGREEKIGFVESLTFAARRLFASWTAPLYPFLGMIPFAVVLFAAGLLMRTDLGAAIVGALWIFALLAGLAVALLFLGWFFGWPLMWPTLAAEGSDAFDALGRSYAFTFQRPLHYFFYVCLAAAIGAFAFTFVRFFGDAVLYLTHYLATWGMGIERATELAMANAAPDATGPLAFAADAMQFFDAGVRVLQEAFLYAFFFSSMTAIYLLLRKDVDHTELDDLYSDGDVEPYDLPPLSSDARGVPLPPTTRPAAASAKEGGGATTTHTLVDEYPSDTEPHRSFPDETP